MRCPLLLVPLLCLLPMRSAAAQDAAVLRGDSLRQAGDLTGAVAAYRNASGPGVAYKLAATFALLPLYADSAFAYLDRALARDTTMRPLWDADLYFLSRDDRWRRVEDRLLDRLQGQVAGPFDREYARALLQIRMNEWAYRYHIMLSFRRLGQWSPITNAWTVVMAEHHAANLERLERLLAEKGWPTFSAVGEEAAYAAGNVVNHADLATRERYLPLLEAACARGEADWERYAAIFDRTELERGRPQVYGTQMERDETGRYVPQRLLDPEHVNERRAEKGMEPIEAQLRRFNEHMARDFGTGNR